jgi:hypothetical protein
VDREIQDRFLSSGRRIDRLELLFCSSILFLCRLEVDHWQPTAPRHFNAQQSRCCSSCLRLPLSSRKLPAAAAVQSSEPDLNKFVDYSPASALPARRTCRSDSASNLNVQRPRACAQANVQRPRAGAQASAGEQGGRSKKAFTKIRSDTCKYGQILTVRMKYGQILTVRM